MFPTNTWDLTNDHLQGRIIITSAETRCIHFHVGILRDVDK